jgi:hypothetical protein
MRSSRVLFCSIAAVVGTAAYAPAAPAQEQDGCPQPGFVLVGDTGSGADRNGNGAVCANPETGEVHDDAGPPRRDYDRNGNFIACVHPDTFVVIDDQPQASDGIEPRCPGPFQLLPILLP